MVEIMPGALNIDQKLFQRELRGNVGPCSVRGLYGSRAWVDDLDIINELYGHRGCVNALSWSQSGHLLASGSDDTCINIHTTKPNFAFNTSIQTGHTANIFSVKFMPFSDNKIVSCAGDWEVRVYDVEYAPTVNTLTSSSKPVKATAVPPPGYRSRSTRVQFPDNMSLPKPTKLYNIGEAGTKVFTSHTDRVKRIVTENSPWLFLTCSEDGEVRQFDLRQPSQYYSRGSGTSEVRFRASLSRSNFSGIDILAGPTGEADERNPPLISYKKHRIELNTISCSVGQPHYIALGGSHQHCFLHDRRMVGRDISTERGQPSSSTENELSSATRCVKRFEPKKPSGRTTSRLRRVRDNGHITACKISDANPNELVVSWSGDSIYLFDINRSSADTRRKIARGLKNGTGEGRVNPEHDRKGKARDSISQSDKLHTMEDSVTECLGSGRKRKRSRDTAGGSATGEAPPRQRSARSSSEGERYDEDGDLVIEFTTGHTEQADRRDGEGEVDLIEIPGHSMMRVAGLVIDMRKELFELQSAERSPASDENGVATLSIMKRSFTLALGLAKVCIERMDDIIDIYRTKNPRRERISASGFKRARARRFVQACGALAYALCGPLQTLAPISRELMERHFGQVQGTPGPESIRSEGIPIFSHHLGWRYSFLQLLISYIRNGLVGIYTLAAQHGYHPAAVGESEEGDRMAQKRFFDGIESWWPYELLSHSPLKGIDSPTEVIIAGGEGEAWKLFREEVEEEEQASVERRVEFWGVKVARALLYREGHIIDFAFINSIYGAGEDALEEVKVVLPLPSRRQRRLSQESRRSTSIEPMSVDTDDEGGETVSDNLPGLIAGSSLEATMFGASDMSTRDGDLGHSRDFDHEDGGHDDCVYSDGTDDDIGGGDDDEEEEEQGEDNDYDDNDSEPENRRRDQWRRWEREIDPQAPTWNAIRTYTGHCNVKTVKDVNFYGLNDEYVVSGSDCGHLFIWDKKTSRLVQLLYGDNDTVNVITGHPYEPQLAVSGIDHTIKIFSPDKIAQSEFLGQERIYGPRNGEEEELGMEFNDDGNPEGSRRRLHDEYAIRSQNDSLRDTGVQEALVTRTLLEDLAARLRRHDAGEDPNFTLGDQCMIS